MTIQILGKNHRTGTGKESGKPYDYTVIHYLVKDSYVEGMAAKTTNIYPDIMKSSEILLEHYYDLQFDEKGRVFSLTAVKV